MPMFVTVPVAGPAGRPTRTEALGFFTSYQQTTIPAAWCQPLGAAAMWLAFHVLWCADAAGARPGRSPWSR